MIVSPHASAFNNRGAHVALTTAVALGVLCGAGWLKPVAAQTEDDFFFYSTDDRWYSVKLIG